jgi:ribose transport system substrate-binding protein
VQDAQTIGAAAERLKLVRWAFAPYLFTPKEEQEMSKRIHYLVLAVLIVAMAAGCAPIVTPEPVPKSTSEAESSAAPTGEDQLSLAGKKIGIAVIGTDHYWDRTAFNSAVATVKELGGTAIGVDGERDDQKHIANHENLIAQEPDAIISILGAADVMEPVFKKIHDAGIPLYTIDHPSIYSINNSTSDNYYIGELIGRTLAENLKGEGKVAVFNGFNGVRICQQRYDLFKYVLQDYPGIEILEPELQDVVSNTIEDARQKTADLLLKYPPGTIDAIHVACWDIPAIGVVQALEEAGRTDVKVFGIDAGPETVPLVAKPDGPFVADVAQLPAEIARTSVLNIARSFAGKEIPKTSYVEVMLVTKENAAQMMEELGFNTK